MWSEKPIVKEGALLTKDGKQKLGPNKWKSRHVRLVQGYVLVFKKINDVEPSQVYLLSSSNLIKETGKTKKDNTFGLETDDEIRLFAVENKDGYHVYIPFTLYTLINWRYGDWITQLETMKKQFPSNDDAVVPKQKRASVLTKAKKNITGKVVSSSMGRDALKSILDEDARENFGLFKQLLVSEFGEEKANEIEADIIKLMVKGHFAYENKALDTESIPKLQDLFKKCCYLLTGAFPMTNETTKKQVLERAAQVIIETKVLVEKVMKPALTPKNFAKIGLVFAQVGSTQFLHNIYLLDKNKTMVSGLNDAMRKFLMER